ncbi:MAG: hypothetical protein ACRDHO_12265 [Actinomycetota bacterium]
MGREDTGKEYPSKKSAIEAAHRDAREAQFSRPWIIDMPPDAFAVVPDRVVKALERLLLVPDWEEANAGFDAMGALFEDLNERVPPPGPDDLTEEEEEELEQDEEGVASSESLPPDLIALLEDELLAADPRETLLRIGCAERIVYEWQGLFVDREKLLGHLLIEHDGQPAWRTEDKDQLYSRHSELHLGE